MFKSNVKRQTGFSLTESMVTLFVVSIGLLGVAGLQVTAKQVSHESIQRTTAAMLAQDMVERLRANSQNLAYFVDKKVTGNTIPNEPSPTCNPGDPCSPEALAAHDLWEWEQLLSGASELQAGTGAKAGGLLEPTGCITSSAAGGPGTYTIAIAWRGKSVLSNPTLNTCGEDTTRYGNGNAYRRLLTMDVYITPIAGGL
jgi:type IV pilus assembly protein PilV